MDVASSLLSSIDVPISLASSQSDWKVDVGWSGASKTNFVSSLSIESSLTKPLIAESVGKPVASYLMLYKPCPSALKMRTAAFVPVIGEVSLDVAPLNEPSDCI